MSQEKFTPLAGYGIKIMEPIFKTEIQIYQSKANLDEKILFGKNTPNTHLWSPKLEKSRTGFVWESRIPRSILVNDLFGIEIQVQCNSPGAGKYCKIFDPMFTKSSFDTPSVGLIQGLNWPTVSDIIRSETATTVYKSLNGLVPEYLSSLFENKSTRNIRELRNTETDLSIPLRKTTNGQRAISFRGPKLWNNLELNVKQAPTLAAFKRKNQIIVW